jgi:hypothetical protein
MDFKEIVQELAAALKAEVTAAQNDPGRAFSVSDGQLIAAVEDGFLYSFRAETHLPIPADSPLKVWINREEVLNGQLVGQEEFEILLTVEQDIGESVPAAKISSEPWFIHLTLRENLLAMIQKPPPSPEISAAAAGLVTLPTLASDDAVAPTVEALRKSGLPGLLPNSAQCQAISNCAGSRLHFVWGPPGTGKTTCLAQVARGLVIQGERVMVLSHSNAAVDVAMLRIADAFSGQGLLSDGKILRVGIPQLEEARKREEMLPEAVLRRRHPEIVRQKESLELAIKQLIRQLKQKSSKQSRAALLKDLEAARAELGMIKTKLAEIRKKLIAGAQVIGATASRLAIDGHVWGWNPDAVIFDEVSMVGFPYVFAAAALTAGRLLLFGDFRQLPPIALSNHRLAERWLARDSFEIAGVKARIEAGRDEPRVTLLEEQHRMAEPIQNVVSSLAYDGKLKSAPGLQARAAALADICPWAGDHIVLLDTSETGCACLLDPRPGSFSRTNPLHSLIAAAAAARFSAFGVRSIGIISPYKAQAKLINNAINGLGLNKSVSVATVHRFQGAERDAIIIDLVDSLPEKRASRLTGSDIELALRLLNVGISRARGKLLIIADLDFVEGYHSGRSPARRLLALCRRHGNLVRLSAQALSQFLGSSPVGWYGSWQDCQDALCQDISSCRNSVSINFYEGYPAHAPLIAALCQASMAGVAVTAFAPYDVAAQLENAPVDVRLLTRPGGFFALLDGAVGYVGGLNPNGLVARIANETIVECQGELLLAAQAVLPPPSAEREAGLSEICGYCPSCGEERRPHARGADRWSIICASKHEPATELDASTLQAIANVLKLTCSTCGGDARAIEAGGNLFLGCPNYSQGCEGAPPSLWQVFEQG